MTTSINEIAKTALIAAVVFAIGATSYAVGRSHGKEECENLVIAIENPDGTIVSRRLGELKDNPFRIEHLDGSKGFSAVGP